MTFESKNSEPRQLCAEASTATISAWNCRRPVGWKDGNGTWVRTCTILTTTPNEVTSDVHNRMPVILDPADYDVWLDPGMKDSAGVSELLKPFDASAMRCYPVSSRVNNVQNDDAECCMPVALESVPQGQLFC